MYLHTGATGTEGAGGCNDDGTSMGATDCYGINYPSGVRDTMHNFGSRLNNVVAPRGIGVEFVDERDVNTSTMHYSLQYTVR